MARLPMDLDIIVMTNSADDDSLKPLVQGAYWAY